MTLYATEEWEAAAVVIAQAFPTDYVEVATWLAIIDETGLHETQPFALVNRLYGVYLFETRRLCVLAIDKISPHRGTLTHIFAKRGPDAINGAEDRARAAACAIGVEPRDIFQDFL